MTEHVLGTLFSPRVSTRMYVRAAIGCIIAYPSMEFHFPRRPYEFHHHDHHLSTLVHSGQQLGRGHEMEQEGMRTEQT